MKSFAQPVSALVRPLGSAKASVDEGNQFQQAGNDARGGGAALDARDRRAVAAGCTGDRQREWRNCLQHRYGLDASRKDTLDAAIAGVNMVELDPKDRSVGYGGLPNEEGIVELDASCMHGPSRRGGAVGALRNIKTPSLVAKLSWNRRITCSWSAKAR